MHKLVDVEDGVMGDEIDHRMAAYEVDYRHAGHLQCHQQARESAQGTRHACHQQRELPPEGIGAHGIVDVAPRVDHTETAQEQHRERERAPAAQKDCEAMPEMPQIEAEEAHEQIVEPQPKGIAQGGQPPADRREEEEGMAQMAHLLDKVYPHIGEIEGTQEPHRPIAIELALLPDMVPRKGLHGMMVTLDEKGHQGEVDGIADESGRQIGHQQAKGLALEIGSSGAAHATVEIARLEKEEAHEIIGPRHHLLPPSVLGMATKGHYVQDQHAHDAHPAEEVKSMVSVLPFHVILA